MKEISKNIIYSSSLSVHQHMKLVVKPIYSCNVHLRHPMCQLKLVVMRSHKYSRANYSTLIRKFNRFWRHLLVRLWNRLYWRWCMTRNSQIWRRNKPSNYCFEIRLWILNARNDWIFIPDYWLFVRQNGLNCVDWRKKRNVFRKKG